MHRTIIYLQREPSGTVKRFELWKSLNLWYCITHSMNFKIHLFLGRSGYVYISNYNYSCSTGGMSIISNVAFKNHLIFILSNYLTPSQFELVLIIQFAYNHVGNQFRISKQITVNVLGEINNQSGLLSLVLPSPLSSWIFSFKVTWICFQFLLRRWASCFVDICFCIQSLIFLSKKLIIWWRIKFQTSLLFFSFYFILVLVWMKTKRDSIWFWCYVDCASNNILI